MKEVIRYQAEDGVEFCAREACEEHEAVIHRVRRANELLDEGASVYACLTESELAKPKHLSEALKRITADTKLVISHWQCRDTPGYSPARFEAHRGSWRLYVCGDAGAWSGPYGDYVNLDDLVRYLSETEPRYGVTNAEARHD